MSAKKPAKKKEEAPAIASLKLHPMTKHREIAAAEMGLKFGYVAEYRPQHLFRDVIVTLWLLSIPAESESEWSVDRAETDPRKAALAAYEWAAKMALSVGTPAFRWAEIKFIETMKEIREAKAEPLIPEGEETEGEMGERSAIL